MARSLKEIRNFNHGIFLNASESDIPDDAASFSLNVNPETEDGILGAIKTNKLFTITNTDIITSTLPVPWGYTGNLDPINVTQVDIMKFKGINAFKNKRFVNVNCIGSKGRLEQLTLDDPIPHFEQIWVDVTSYTYKWKPPVAIAATDTSFTILENTNTITDTFKATATITITDVTEINNGDKVNLIATDSTSHDFTAGDVAGGGTWVAETDNNTTATNLATQINANTKFSASANSAVVTVTQAISGSTEGSTTVTLTDSGTAGMSKTDFTTSWTVSGFDADGAASITIGGNTLSDYDGETFVVLSPDGRSVTYQFDSTDGGTATGAPIATTNCCVQIFNASPTVSTIAAQVKAAIENTTNGHGVKRIAITQATGLLTLTLRHRTLSEHLIAGQYITLFTSGWVHQTTEIMQISSISGTTVNVERGCFNTTAVAYSASTTYNLMANLASISGLNAQVISTDFYCNISEWSDYSGNNIGGGGRHWMQGFGTHISNAKNGLIDTNEENYSVTFNSTDKTVIFGFQAPLFNEGDRVTFYFDSTGTDALKANQGFSATILKKTGAYTWTLDNAPTSDTLDDNIKVYIEASLIKNCTLTHAVDSSTQDVGASENYIVNDWLCRATGITNAYTNTTSTEISTNTTPTPYHYGRNESSDLVILVDSEERFYPFIDSKSLLQILANYTDTDKDINGAITAEDTTISTDSGINSILAAGNIIMLTTTTAEYMKVTSVNSTSINVIRGYNNSTAIAHGDNTSIFVNAVESIYQPIDKDLLLSGQKYTLSFYVKGVVNTADTQGAVALTYNGSCFNKEGEWELADTDGLNGYVINPGGRAYSSSASNITQEKKWIEFKLLGTDVSGVDENNLLTASGWRRFFLTFTIPEEMKVLSDLGIEFTNLGIDNSSFVLDQLDLLEYNPMYTVESSGYGMTSILDNSGIKDLILFDNKKHSFSVLNDVFSTTNPLVEYDSIESSRFVSETIYPTDFAVSKNNRELHIGLGGSESSSYPEWIGYINHKLFGQDFTGDLYRDEDTVHAYESGGGSALSKITVAGEFEYLVAVWDNGASTLTISHTAHKLLEGDNIVIREWADSAGEWTGKGVWTVTDATATGANDFVCKRFTDLDNNPSDENFLPPTGATRNTNTGRICYRPFYYYGIRNGDKRLYRITPKNRLTGETTIAEDTETYIEGKIELSLPLPTVTTSIATCYSKSDEGGLGGGKVYILSKDTNAITVIDVMVGYDKWLDANLSYTTFEMQYKAFKWSNEREDGNITATQGVFGGLSNVSTPDIIPSGVPSDIIETKGPTKDFVHDTEDSNGNDTEHFDTRLWVQFHPGGNNSFHHGSRFLFCGKSLSTNIVTGATMNMADRTPATNYVSQTNYYGWVTGVPIEGYTAAGKMHVPVTYATYSSSKKCFYFDSYRKSDDNGSMDLEVLYGRTQNGFRADYDRGSDNDDGSSVPYVNFGENIGFYGGPPQIKIPNYGLFAISDNDKDGLLDGTGIVVPSTKTLHTVGYADSEFENPYGNASQRVTAHAVGLIAVNESGNNWWRRAGKIQGLPGGGMLETFQSMYKLQGSNSSDTQTNKMCHEAPSLATMNKFIWICPDMHLGDDPELSKTFNYTAITESSDDTNSSGGDVADTSLCIFTVSETTAQSYALQAGDIIFVDDSTGQDFAAGHSGTQGISATVVAIDHDSRKITTNLRWGDYGSTGTGVIHPYTSYYPLDGNDSGDSGGGTGGGWDGRRGMPDNKHYHFCYNEDDPLNGSCFTEDTSTTSKGFYTKTWYTNPTALDGWYGSPGVLYNVDKLNFRAGAMMRPLINDFSILDINNHLAIDMPTFPEQVFHIRNGDYRHYNVNSAGVDLTNSTANRLFIASPSSELGHSNIWAVDLEYMKASSVTHSSIYYNHSGGGTISIDGGNVPMSGYNTSWNDIDHNSYFRGTIDEDCVISSAASRHYANATRNPVLKIGGNITLGSSFFTNDSRPYSVKGGINRLAGCCITVIDQTTGYMQTRYIVSSVNANINTPGTTLYLSVHYPFAHKPVSGDYFAIWGHADACTAEIRTLGKRSSGALNDTYISQPHTNQLIPMFDNTSDISLIEDNGTTVFVTTSLRHNLEQYRNTINGNSITISGTVNYNGVYSGFTVTSPLKFHMNMLESATYASETTGTCTSSLKNATSNPILAEVLSPMMKATFGGLDLRNYRNVTVSGADNDGTDHQGLSSTAHKMDTGDEIVFDSGSDSEANYTMRDGGANVIDIFTTDISAAGGTVYKENFELFTIEKGGSGQSGYIRSSFSRWDLGNKDSNILNTDGNPKYFPQGTSLVKLIGASPSSDGDFFESNKDYKYRLSLIYDGYQEGPLSEGRWVYNESSTKSIVNITISIGEVSKRLTHVCLYRKDSAFDYYRLIKEIPTEDNWSMSEEGGVSDGLFEFIVTDDGSLGASYEARTGVSEILDTIQVKYGLSAKVDGYLFVGDCAHEKIVRGSNMLFRSRPGMFSIFDYVNDTVTLESKPTALVNFNGRLYAFDKSNIYRINQQTLTIEDVFEGVGCLNKNSIIVTEYGMFFADKNGAYMHNGSLPTKISAPIHRGGDIATTFGGTDNIKDVSWDNVVTKSKDDDVIVFYDANISCVLYKVNYLGLETDGTSKSIQYIWSYHLIQKRWDLWELAENSIIGKPFSGDDGSVYIPINNAIFKHRGGANKRDYTWVSKKLSMDEDSSVKVFNRIKLNAVDINVNLGGSYAESSDRLLIATNTGLIASDDVTYSSKDTGHSQYKLSGSNKKGRWLQFKLEDMTEDVDSVGIIFRKKPIK